MSEKIEKVRIGLLIDKEVLKQADSLLETADVRSRNEFIGEAVKFYAGYLNSRKGEDYLLQSLSSVLTSTIHDSESRLAKMDFKLAVELSKLAHVIAYANEIDENALDKLHSKCIDEVKMINGVIDFQEAYHYQRGKL